jgi:peptidase E
VASEGTFVNDCLLADVIYLHGGNTVKIMEVLKRYQNLEQVFSDRIIAGDSAGVNVLGQLFYSKNSKEIGEGLKILPFKILVHYVDGAPNPLAQIEPDLETFFLHEYETKVFYKKAGSRDER